MCENPIYIAILSLITILSLFMFVPGNKIKNETIVESLQQLCKDSPRTLRFEYENYTKEKQIEYNPSTKFLLKKELDKCEKN